MAGEAMKVSGLISVLSLILEMEGDLEVYYKEWEDPHASEP
jgi:hypothetical protein